MYKMPLKILPVAQASPMGSVGLRYRLRRATLTVAFFRDKYVKYPSYASLFRFIYLSLQPI